MIVTALTTTYIHDMHVSAAALEDADHRRRTATGGLRPQSRHPRTSKQPPVSPKDNIAIACHAILCLSVSHRIPFLPLSLCVCVCQRVKELDEALLAADEQYAALQCSVADRKAVLSVEELQQVQASICCP